MSQCVFFLVAHYLSSTMTSSIQLQLYIAVRIIHNYFSSTDQTKCFRRLLRISSIEYKTKKCVRQVDSLAGKQRPLLVKRRKLSSATSPRTTPFHKQSCKAPWRAREDTLEGKRRHPGGQEKTPWRARGDTLEGKRKTR